MKVVKSADLFYKEGSSDKVYKASIEESAEGFTVNFAYGRRGSSLATGTKTPKPVPLDKAEKIYDKLLLEKSGKGYVADPTGKVFSVGDLESRDTGFRPQLLNEIEEDQVEFYIESPHWCAQEKFDGRRRGVIINGGTATGTNRKGLSVALDDSIISDIKAYLPKSLKCTWDGEAFDGYIMLFDQIEAGFSYEERYKMLSDTLKRSAINSLRLVETAWTVADKRRLYNKLKKNNAEGIVFKKISAEYKPGRPNKGGDQLKFKFCATASCVVTGVNSGKRSVSLAVFNTELTTRVDVGNVTVYPNQDIPEVGDVVEVKYLYYFSGGSLFQPVLLGQRDDVLPHECLLKQLKLKKDDE